MLSVAVIDAGISTPRRVAYHS